MKTPEERQETKAYRELRKENIRLRRQLKEMRREMRFIEEAADSENDFVFVALPAPQVEKFPCPKCGSTSTSVFQLVGRDYYRCLSCDAKGRK